MNKSIFVEMLPDLSSLVRGPAMTLDILPLLSRYLQSVHEPFGAIWLAGGAIIDK